MSFPLIYHSSLSAHIDAYGPYFFSAMTKHNKYTVEGFMIKRFILFMISSLIFIVVNMMTTRDLHNS